MDNKGVRLKGGATVSHTASNPMVCAIGIGKACTQKKRWTSNIALRAIAGPPGPAKGAVFAPSADDLPVTSRPPAVKSFPDPSC